MYTILDIIDNLVYIVEKEISIFKDISNDENKDIRIKIMSDAIKKQCKKHKDLLENLKMKIGNELEEYVDFHSYDKISSRIQEFKGRIHKPNINSLDDFKNWLLCMEKDNLALLLDIRGRLVKKEIDINSLAYSIISRIVNEQKQYINMLVAFFQ